MAEEAERFTALYDACRQHVWAYAVSRAGRQVADEVVSETFVIAWRRFADIPEPPLPWLLGVARNALRDSARAQARREALTAEVQGWNESPEEDFADEVADRNLILRALASLGEGDREALVLTAWHGLHAHEAAKVVGCSATTMRVRLHRARKRLAQALDLDRQAPPVATFVPVAVKAVGEEA
ncbi:RNA polymerase sigma factor [Streptomyces sp. BK340]|uniref:RNA polymerase sigma factor n=1 Tax=Streptomyces sp. BK340 TaxID=2572903 RepID=UPI0011A1F6AD|nr:sigma-70 family RNA polymerase sigma factor [Streptomyces sp. BK340]TVZ90414.1 RNA polymerase sigma-70 factor (ECF subfamily) [Streptomyces sp. BK340]